MLLAYNLFIYTLFILFSPVILFFALFDLFQFRERLSLREPAVLDSRKSIWLHGASMGEVAIIGRILPDLRQKYPRHLIVVSSTTRSGQEHIRRHMAEYVSHTVYLPLEIPFIIRRMLRFVNPEKVVLVETELWPNFILEAKRFGARVVLINGRISDRLASRI